MWRSRRGRVVVVIVIGEIITIRRDGLREGGGCRRLVRRMQEMSKRNHGA